MVWLRGGKVGAITEELSNPQGAEEAAAVLSPRLLLSADTVPVANVPRP